MAEQDGIVNPVLLESAQESPKFAIITMAVSRRHRGGHMKMSFIHTAVLSLLAVATSSWAQTQSGPEFSTALSPATVTLPQGSVTSFSLTIESTERPKFSITLGGLPDGVQAQTLAGHAGINTVILRSSSDATLGSFGVTVTASAGGNSQTQLLTLVVKPMPIAPQWEYTVVGASSDDEFVAYANNLGSQGWELVNVRFREQGAPAFVGFFKRIKR
jgi:hypothetical protein